MEEQKLKKRFDFIIKLDRKFKKASIEQVRAIYASVKRKDVFVFAAICIEGIEREIKLISDIVKNVSVRRIDMYRYPIRGIHKKEVLQFCNLLKKHNHLRQIAIGQDRQCNSYFLYGLRDYPSMLRICLTINVDYKILKQLNQFKKQVIVSVDKRTSIADVLKAFDETSKNSIKFNRIKINCVKCAFQERILRIIPPSAIEALLFNSTKREVVYSAIGVVCRREDCKDIEQLYHKSEWDISCPIRLDIVTGYYNREENSIFSSVILQNATGTQIDTKIDLMKDWKYVAQVASGVFSVPNTVFLLNCNGIPLRSNGSLFSQNIREKHVIRVAWLGTKDFKY